MSVAAHRCCGVAVHGRAPRPAGRAASLDAFMDAHKLRSEHSRGAGGRGGAPVSRGLDTFALSCADCKAIHRCHVPGECCARQLEAAAVPIVHCRVCMAGAAGEDAAAAANLYSRRPRLLSPTALAQKHAPDECAVITCHPTHRMCSSRQHMSAWRARRAHYAHCAPAAPAILSAMTRGHRASALASAGRSASEAHVCICTAALRQCLPHPASRGAPASRKLRAVWAWRVRVRTHDPPSAQVRAALSKPSVTAVRSPVAAPEHRRCVAGRQWRAKCKNRLSCRLSCRRARFQR